MVLCHTLVAQAPFGRAIAATAPVPPIIHDPRGHQFLMTPSVDPPATVHLQLAFTNDSDNLPRRVTTAKRTGWI